RCFLRSRRGDSSDSGYSSGERRGLDVKLATAIAVVVVLAVVVSMLGRGRGYGGAIGFKNRHAIEIATIRLTGFSKPVDCRTLRRGEHSFNYLGRQDMPSEVQIAWRFVCGTSRQNRRVSFIAVPNGPDGW